MKNLVLLFVVFISFSLFAQDDSNYALINDGADEWMVKISTDSEMRVKMMDMIIDKTKGNEIEVRKIVNSISNNPKLRQMIVDTYSEKTNAENISIEPIGFDKDSIKVGIMLGTQQASKPKQ